MLIFVIKAKVIIEINKAVLILKNGINFSVFKNNDEIEINTENIINGIYRFLELPIYKHKYDNIEHINLENDLSHGMPEMHKVKPTISRSENNPLDILSERIIKKYSDLEFWRKK